MSESPVEESSKAEQEEPLGFWAAWLRNCRSYFLTGLLVSTLVAAGVVAIAWFFTPLWVAVLLGTIGFLGTFFEGFIEKDPKRRL